MSQWHLIVRFCVCVWWNIYKKNKKNHENTDNKNKLFFNVLVYESERTKTTAKRSKVKKKKFF